MLVAAIISVSILIWCRIIERKQATENEEKTENPVYEEIDNEMVIDPSSRVPIASCTDEDEPEYI